MVSDDSYCVRVQSLNLTVRSALLGSLSEGAAPLPEICDAEATGMLR